MVLGFLPQLTVADLRELAAPGVVPENLRKYLQTEVHRRMRASKRESENESAIPGKKLRAQAKDEEGSEEE